jgi:hypothetical protein
MMSLPSPQSRYGWWRTCGRRRSGMGGRVLTGGSVLEHERDLNEHSASQYLHIDTLSMQSTYISDFRPSPAVHPYLACFT